MKNEQRIAVLIKAGVDWLKTEQPAGALISRWGIQTVEKALFPYEDMAVSIALQPNSIKRHSCFVFESATLINPRSDTSGYLSISPAVEADLVALVRAAATVIAVHHLRGRDSFTVETKHRAGPTLYAAMNLYREGCPNCIPVVARSKLTYCRCGYMKAGRAKVIIPEGWR